MAWIAIIIIHHRRIGLPSTYPSTTGFCRLVDPRCSFESSIRLCLCHPFFVQLSPTLICCLSCHHCTASPDQKEAACFNAQDFAQSSTGSCYSIDWSCQGSRCYLHTTPPHQGELMQVHWPWLLGTVPSFSPTQHLNISWIPTLSIWIPQCL